MIHSAIPEQNYFEDSQSSSLKVEVVDHNTKVFVLKQFKECRNRYNFSTAKQ